MIETFTVTNPRGESLTLELKRPVSGMIIKSIGGLGPVDATINFSEFGSGDGSMFNSARVGTRNIVLTLAFMENPTIEAVRQATNRYFPNKKFVNLSIVTTERSVKTFGCVERNEPSIFTSEAGTTISIVCPGPNLVDITNQITNQIPSIMAVNPTLAVDMAGYGCGGGPGGAATGSRQTNGGYSGKTYYRSTITTQASDTGPTISCPQAKITPGVTYTFSAWVRAAGNLAGRVNFYKDGLSTGNPVVGAGGTIGGVWARRFVTFTAPPNVDTANLSFGFGGFGIYTPAVGSTLDVDAVLYEVAAAPSTYSEWVGDSLAIRRNIWSYANIATELATWHTIAGVTGAAAISSVANGGVQGGAFIRATWSVAPSGGDLGSHTAPGVYQDPQPCYYGDTYRVSVWVRPSATMTVYGACQFYNAASVVLGAEVVIPAPVVCSGGVWTRVSMTVTPPSGAVNMRMYYYTLGSSIQLGGGANLMDVDQLMCERGTTDGSYFENVNLTVDYQGEVDTGFIMKIRALTPATNVTITKLETGEFFKIDTTTWLRILGVDTWALLHDGDTVVVNSQTGQKSLMLDRSFYGINANVINSMTRDSSWLKLTPGTNTFEIKADTGLDSLRFSVESPLVYEGV